MEEEQLKKLLEITQKKISKIETSNNQTVIEFKDGEVLNLFGGQSFLGAIQQAPCCSYCGKPRDKNNPMISPDNHPKFMICSHCTVKALEMFLQSGVELELDLSFLLKQ